MIAACYSMDLYCDCLACTVSRGGLRLSPRQYTGETWADCAKQAKRDGWKISRDRQSAYAPGHAPKAKP